MPKIYSNLFILTIFAIILGGCQTGQSSTLNGSIAQSYKELTARNCVIVRNGDDSGPGYDPKKISETINIYSIAEGNDNWHRVDVSTVGVRSNIYHNTSSGRFICGWKNWRKLELNDTFSDAKLISTKSLLKDANPNQRVICGISGTWGHIELSEYECIEKGCVVVKKVASLPPHIKLESYINCLRPNETETVIMKAGMCMQDGGQVVRKTN